MSKHPVNRLISSIVRIKQEKAENIRTKQTKHAIIELNKITGCRWWFLLSKMTECDLIIFVVLFIKQSVMRSTRQSPTQQSPTQQSPTQQSPTQQSPTRQRPTRQRDI